MFPDALLVEAATYLAHGAVVGVPHHEGGGCWREELLQTLVAGQRRVNGFNVLKAETSFQKEPEQSG